MKIGVATDDQVNIASHFGRAQGFMIYVIDKGSVVSQEFRPNSFTAHSQRMESHGAGHHSHEPILAALRDCMAVIASGMGRRIYDDLCNAGIEAFITNETECEKAAQLYLQGKLINHPERGCDHNH